MERKATQRTGMDGDAMRRDHGEPVEMESAHSGLLAIGSAFAWRHQTEKERERAACIRLEEEWGREPDRQRREREIIESEARQASRECTSENERRKSCFSPLVHQW